jgi:DNA repair protein RecO (recombination protein O)
MYSKYTGIILKKHPLGEADELLTIYTKETGKMRVRAKSVRKIKSRLAGHLETLNEIEFEAARSGKTNSTARIPVLTSARIVTINSYLRQNLEKFAHALVGTETMYRMIPDEEENQVLYALLNKFLTTLGEAGDDRVAVRNFQIDLLDACGYRFPGGNLDEFLDYVLEREIKATKFLTEIRENYPNYPNSPN